MKTEINQEFIDSQDLHNFKIKASDGDIGEVFDFYFHQRFYHVRYFVINTTSFLKRHLVLISPISIKKVDIQNKIIEVDLTKDQIQNSPVYDSETTISDFFETKYSHYYGWPSFWYGNPQPWVLNPFGINWPIIDTENMKKSKPQPDVHKRPQIRSANEIGDYSIKGNDDRFGHIQGHLINIKTFAIEYFIIDTINFFPSKLILMKPEWSVKISWKKKEVEFPFSKKLIKDAPSYSFNRLSQNLLDETKEHFYPHYVRPMKDNDAKMYPPNHKINENRSSMLDKADGSNSSIF